jgi:hypothetical protein
VIQISRGFDNYRYRSVDFCNFTPAWRCEAAGEKDRQHLYHARSALATDMPSID